MRALFRIAAVAVAGSALYYAGLLNSILQLQPWRPGAPAVVLAIAASIAVVLLALRGTGRDDAASPPSFVRLHRAIWLFVSVMALVSLAWLYTAPRQHAFDWTPYHNDAIALNECAARLVLDGSDPYQSLDVFACYDGFEIGPDRTTPLRRGLFANDVVYPTDDEMDRAWAVRGQEGGNVEFVTRPSYPSLSFLLLLPFVAAGWDTNYLYLLCLAAGMALVLARTSAGMRPFMLTGLLGAASLIAFTVGGSSDLLYALPLVVAWVWRERRWSAVAFGVAAATKQIAWFVAPFYVVATATAVGWRETARRAAIAIATFLVPNAPYIAHDARAWTLGVLTPVVEPMFPRGAGLVFLGTNGGGPLWPPAVYLGLEAVAALVCLAVAWRGRRTSPEMGIVLALVPLFFGWRSLFSYFFLIPLFAFAGLARMPLGELAPEGAREAGALTLFAVPAGRPAA